jgi:protein-S-isoprenylcysteine O-methyltransferase Ste14
MNPYLAAFPLLWAIFVGYWLIHWGGNKRTVRTARSLPRILLAAVLIWLLISRRQLPLFWLQVLVPHSPAVEIAGILICAGGVAVAIWARRTLGTNWSANPAIKEGHQLVEAGPYRWVRHPIYTGVLLAVLGSALGGGRLIHAAILLAVAISFWFKLRVEEKLMLQQFPEAYPEYMRRTKALVPGLL